MYSSDSKRQIHPRISSAVLPVKPAAELYVPSRVLEPAITPVYNKSEEGVRQPSEMTGILVTSSIKAAVPRVGSLTSLEIPTQFKSRPEMPAFVMFSSSSPALVCRLWLCP